MMAPWSPAIRLTMREWWLLFLLGIPFLAVLAAALIAWVS